MRNVLPLLESRAAETRLCTYCPKLCRPACPVSTVEGRETVTPWGKMRAQGELTRESLGQAQAEARSAVSYACTGCGHCTTLCLLDNPVADTLRDGRADAFAAGLAPERARDFAARFPERLARIAKTADALGAPDAPRGDGSTAWIPGCTSVVFEGGDVAETTRAVARLSPSGGCTLAGAICCGAPLLDAGDREGFVAHARGVAEALGGYRHLVVGDAGCAYALKVLYPRLGVAAPAWERVEHVSELAARNTHLLRVAPDARKVVVHDSCRLGRGMGVYEAPRAVLRAVTGAAPAELPMHHERAPCSGAGGLLPVTMPDTAAGIARETAADVAEASGTGASGAEASGAEKVVVVTSCPASRRALRRAGVDAEDLSVWIARGVPR